MSWVWFLAGFAVGVGNGLSLWRVVRRLEPGRPRRSRMRVASSRWLRWVGATVLLALALQAGIVPGLLAFAGLWIARWSLVIWWSRAQKPLELLRK
jgi:hypothetical protein